MSEQESSHSMGCQKETSGYKNSQENTYVTLKLKNEEFLSASRTLLTTQSPVLQRFIDELKFDELEFDDFDPEVVVIFLRALEAGAFNDVEKQQFRELHKMGKVFEVKWLKEGCHIWFGKRVKELQGLDQYEEKAFLFRESEYALEKWSLTGFMEELLSKMMSFNDINFVTKYIMENMSCLSKNGLNCLLILGKCNLTPFIELIIYHIKTFNKLDKNIKYILESINLEHCAISNPELYHSLFYTISQEEKIEADQINWAFRLSSRISIQATQAMKKRNSNRVIYNTKDLAHLYGNITTVADITEKVAAGEFRSMFGIVEIIVNGLYTRTTVPSEEEMIWLVNSLNSSAAEGAIRRRVSGQFIDMCLGILKSTDALRPNLRPNATSAIKILDMIRRSTLLTSSHENVHVRATKIEQMPLQKKVFPLNYASDHFIRENSQFTAIDCITFSQKIPDKADCNLGTACGFILSWDYSTFAGEVSLLTDPAEYLGSTVHLHDYTKPENIYFYKEVVITTHSGDTLILPSLRWRIWLESYRCKSYSTENYMVAYNYADQCVFIGKNKSLCP